MPRAVSTRTLLVTASVLCYGCIFLAFVFFEVPGRGIGHFYYIAIALLALATGPRVGALAGALAAMLWTAGALLAPNLDYSNVPLLSSGIRFLVFSVVGALIGNFAARNRALVAELRTLAERDQLTGLPNTRAFEAAITRRLERGTSFALLVGDTRAIDDEQSSVEGGDALRRLAEQLASSLHADDEIARLGTTSFAILTSDDDVDAAARVAARLERIAAGGGSSITFGWSVFPQDGDNALALYRAADERMYARKLIRDRSREEAPRELWAPRPATPAS